MWTMSILMIGTKMVLCANSIFFSALYPVLCNREGTQPKFQVFSLAVALTYGHEVWVETKAMNCEYKQLN